MNVTYTKTGRNDLCPCGSGKKFKKCCINKNNFNFQNISQWEKILDIEDENLDEVKSLIRNHYHANKKNGEYLNNLAVMLGSSKYFEEALYFHKKAISVDGNDEVIKLNYANTIANMGKKDEAIQIIETLSDKTDRKLVIEANIKKEIIPFEEVEKIYEKAISFDPTFYLPYVNIIENTQKDETRNFWIKKGYEHVQNDPDITYFWAELNFKEYNYELLSNDEWINNIQDLSGDYSIVGRRDYIPEQIEYLKKLNLLSKFLYNLHYEEENKSKIQLSDVIDVIDYFINYSNGSCLVIYRIFDLISYFGLINKLKNVHDGLCDDCKKNIIYDGLKYQILKNIPDRKKDALELGHKLCENKDANKNLGFVSTHISFVDDELGSAEAIKLSEKILNNNIDKYKNPYSIKIIWDLAIIACKSGNWILARDCFERFKGIDYSKFLNNQIPTIKYYYEKEMKRSFFWVDYNIFICDLALKKFNDPNEYKFLEWFENYYKINLVDADINYLKEIDKYIKELHQWCKMESQNKFYINEFLQKIRNTSYFSELYGKVKSENTFISVNDLISNKLKTNLASNVSNKKSLMQHYMRDEGDFSGLFNILEEEIPQLRLMPEVAISSLIEAENRTQNEKNVFDYSPAIVSYCKSIEVLIREEIFSAFIKTLVKNFEVQKLITEASEDKNYNQFFGLIKYFKTGFLELGTISQIIKLTKGKTGERVKILQHLKNFLEKNFPKMLEINFSEDLNMLSKDYRNLATHEKSSNKLENDLVRKKIFQLINELLALRLYVKPSIE